MARRGVITINTPRIVRVNVGGGFDATIKNDVYLPNYDVLEKPYGEAKADYFERQKTLQFPKESVDESLLVLGAILGLIKEPTITGGSNYPKASKHVQQDVVNAVMWPHNTQLVVTNSKKNNVPNFKETKASAVDVYKTMSFYGKGINRNDSKSKMRMVSSLVDEARENRVNDECISIEERQRLTENIFCMSLTHGNTQNHNPKVDVLIVTPPVL